MLYNALIKKHLNIKINHLGAYILETKKPILKNKTYYDTVRIIFPFIITTPEIQFIMRDEFIKHAGPPKIGNVRA